MADEDENPEDYYHYLLEIEFWKTFKPAQESLKYEAEGLIQAAVGGDLGMPDQEGDGTFGHVCGWCFPVEKDPTPEDMEGGHVEVYKLH